MFFPNFEVTDKLALLAIVCWTILSMNYYGVHEFLLPAVLLFQTF